MSSGNGLRIIGVQRRMMQLGRVRLGDEKSDRSPGRPLPGFRFTTASEALARAVAERYGGTATPWEGADDVGYWQVKTEAAELAIILPPVFSDADGTPTVPFSQWFELWKGGGCERRCDGETESLSGQACLCTAGERACQPTTRLSFILPEIPGIGVWRLDTKGYNAAAEMPGTIEVLLLAAAERKFIPATLRIEHRTKKLEGKTKRFVVPVIDLPETKIGDILPAAERVALNAPPAVPREKPALPAAAPLPAETAFAAEAAPGFGQRPALSERSSGGPSASGSSDESLGGAGLSAREAPRSESAEESTGGRPMVEEGPGRESSVPAPALRSPLAQEITTEILRDKLLAAADKLGKREATLKRVERNAATNAADPGKHAAWLDKQVRAAEEKAAQLEEATT